MKNTSSARAKPKCHNCDLRDSSFFCNFSQETLEGFESIKFSKVVPKGINIFIEGQACEGIYVICRGRVTLKAHSTNGKVLILRVANPGEVLGLSAAISGGVNETTAEAIEECQVSFIPSSDFIRFLERYPEAGMTAIRELCSEQKTAFAQIRRLGLTKSVADKLVLLLLEWSKRGQTSNGSVHLNVSFSHEAIAEMIGSSRETVTRLLVQFRQAGLISINGTDLFIPDKARLESTIGNRNNGFAVADHL